MRHLLCCSILCALVACSPQEQVFDTTPDRVASLHMQGFETADGTLLPVRQWVPKGRPKAVLIALHGFNDYSKAFESTGSYLSTRNIAVFAYDQRGFGASAQTGIWGGERNYISDLRQWVEYMDEQYPDVPLYVLGESMGAAVVINALAEKDFPPVEGAVLVSPAVWGGDTINPFYRIAVIISAHTFPYYEVTGEGLEIQATDNIELLREMSKDPLVLKSTRIDAVYGVVNLMDSAYNRIPDIRDPILFLSGGKDEVIPPSAMEIAWQRFQNPVDCRYYPGGYHMLLRDLNGAEIQRDLADWMLKKAKKRPESNCFLTKSEIVTER